MEDKAVFWDKNIEVGEIKSALSDESHPEFIELAALLLSRVNQPKEVFDNYIDKKLFCRNWRRIKRRMRRNKWNDARIIFWDEVYRVAAKGMDKDELKRADRRPLSQDAQTAGIFAKIREVRLRFGLTQAQLGEKAGLSQQTVSFVEKGYVNISLQTLNKITAAIGLKIYIAEREDML